MVNLTDFGGVVTAPLPGKKKYRGKRDEKQAFGLLKRAFDIVFSLLLLPAAAAIAGVLLILNPLFNPGPLFYRQRRMGRHCEPFMIYKFRSMVPAGAVERSADDPVEANRIRPLGCLLRQTRLDELPQLLNVLRGDMSLIGPRPDYYDHATRFLQSVPGYRERHKARPGISGLAQIRLGYAEGIFATKRKARMDLFYIRNQSVGLEIWIFWRTLFVVFGRIGAK